ncbi:HTH-type transcriptional activator RhaS [Desulfosporosinus acididurans]|uniref:HTH-type transcriptional activator RhaS n=1 Tax=Desulfosporosinus acididurans TaxID=476652 RepID=A0A0J1FMZ1_9FIRM|nr:AraC family transcriptional regulator [Desulfosporosinus acididurans]KLU64874.1 HTH-type transcriptional activator RhaS [Desulfosporosinus acididurans]
MVNEIRNICYDTDLNIEAYQFLGIMQKFPNHFHDYYVLGFIESGKRYLTCNNQDYILNAGNITIFNPHDTHACEQVDGKALDYRCINIEPNIMRRTAAEITGNDSLPHFKQTVLYHNELAASLRELNLMIFEEENDFIKEELFLFLIEQLIEEYSDTIPKSFSQEPTTEIKTACAYLESNYAQPITLDKLSELTELSKYHLLRSFTRQKGISPYSYLITIRINNAKKLLEQGMSPLDVAFQTGFSDQSHFSNFFKKLIGLTPKQYLKIFQNNPKPLLSMGEEI